jgi:integrase/recombinase XerD
MCLPILSIEDVKYVLAACSNPRDKAIILFMVDTGLRRSEVCALNWGDVDLSNGICIVQKGKGKKARSVVLGNLSRRALLTYRRNVVNHENGDPLFQTSSGSWLSPYGLRSVFVRFSEKAGVKVSVHALRRTFVVMSLKGGMSLAHVQALMGHNTPKMT